MVQLGSDGIFTFRLFDEPIILFGDSQDMLQCPDLLGLAVLDGIDAGSRTVAQMSEDVVPIDGLELGHEIRTADRLVDRHVRL